MLHVLSILVNRSLRSSRVHNYAARYQDNCASQTRRETAPARFKMASDCIFCNIISGKHPNELIYEDEELVIFKDIKPAAEHHYLAVTKRHIKNVNELTTNDKELVEKLMEVGKRVLQELGADVNDLRMGFHVPPFNSISHLHLHLITPTTGMGFLSRRIFQPNTWWFATAEYILANLKKPSHI
ncbi:histidine triad nucleotide-binding protein 3 [Photinus pyralis]|nr:histidine triad nucleotide-binding protein 3 [Photinus pyralis]